MLFERITLSAKGVCRGEVGMDMGRVALTWREVMVRPRLEARSLYRTVNLETNLLGYLTINPRKIKQRYSRQ